MADLRQQAKDLGYIIESEGNQTMRVRGFGLDTCYTEDNEQAWKDLVEGHEERVEELESRKA